jgi:hypothetical protein
MEVNKIWLGYFLDVPLSTLFKEFQFMKNSGCHGNQSEKLKYSSSHKPLVEFQNSSTEMILGWTSTKIVKMFDMSKNMAARGRVSFPYMAL